MIIAYLQVMGRPSCGQEAIANLLLFQALHDSCICYARIRSVWIYNCERIMHTAKSVLYCGIEVLVGLLKCVSAYGAPHQNFWVGQICHNLRYFTSSDFFVTAAA